MVSLFSLFTTIMLIHNIFLTNDVRSMQKKEVFDCRDKVYLYVDTVG